MKKLKTTAAGTIALLAFALLGQAALAAEWNPGHFDEPGGNVPAKYVAASECVFNGRDEPDVTEAPLGGGDDADWAQTPSGGKVQSGGQITAAGAQLGDPSLIVPTGVQGQACNPTAEPFPEP